jgi:hypothetical protein
MTRSSDFQTTRPTIQGSIDKMTKEVYAADPVFEGEAPNITIVPWERLDEDVQRRCRRIAAHLFWWLQRPA